MKMLLAAMLALGTLLLLPAFPALPAGAGFASLDKIGFASDSGAPSAGSNDSATPTVTLRAASGATIPFKTGNGEGVEGHPSQEWELPHLVLFRNGELTEPQERTLIVEIDGLAPPPAGITVTLRIETQHRDPDQARGLSARITVWEASTRVAAEDPAGSLVLEHQFDGQFLGGNDPLVTPTDYFRYEIAVTDEVHPPEAPLWRMAADHAFLMESQWVVQLPAVAESSPGAAPDELVLYACDMFPWRKGIGDADTWLSRQELPAYLENELIPAMVEAFWFQTDVWNFPWHEAWTSYRTGADAERLSVALSDGETWFHGRAPGRGHSGISIAGRATADYESLIDALMGRFHHELFHNLQRNINLGYGGDGNVDGVEDAWEFITEGTAVLATSVGQLDVEFSANWTPRNYMSHASDFSQNSSYREMSPYRSALYWRFLYESCGGMSQGVEDPAAGMQVIRQVLVALYSGEVVDIRRSAELVEKLPAVMDLALSRSPNCPFHSYRESLDSFAHAVYLLRLSEGRCTAPGLPAGCGLYDPHALYRDPLAGRLSYSGETLVYAHGDQPDPAGIAGSYGFDFVEVELDVGGGVLALELSTDRPDGTEFGVQMVKLIESNDGPVVVSPPEKLARIATTGQLSIVVPGATPGEFKGLGLIITRIDSREGADPVGAYTLVLRPAG
jgi:hypothetical protein